MAILQEPIPTAKAPKESIEMRSGGEAKHTR
jgi:hypothetical protein